MKKKWFICLLIIILATAGVILQNQITKSSEKKEGLKQVSVRTYDSLGRISSVLEEVIASSDQHDDDL